MEQNGRLPAVNTIAFQTAENMKIIAFRHSDHKSTMYIVADMKANCNTFRKKFQNSSLFIMIRLYFAKFGFIRQKSIFCSAFLPNSPVSSPFCRFQNAKRTAYGILSCPSPETSGHTAFFSVKETEQKAHGKAKKREPIPCAQ